MKLLVDTSRLPRKEFEGRELTGQVVLIDQDQRNWPYEVHVTVERPTALDSDVAFDWGTTNSCGAFLAMEQGKEDVHEVTLSDASDDPEQFASDMYFVDASVPDQLVFHIGPTAQQLSDGHPACCLRSVKRKFQNGGKVQIIDEHHGHKIYSYDIDLVVQQLLHRLVTLAETALKKELLKIGLTFPTKWKKETRDRFARVAEALQRNWGKSANPAR